MNKIIFMVGESGSGKTTLQNRMINKEPLKYTNITSCTTRDSRAGEVEGKDYHFKTENQFKELDLIQSVNFGGNYYGTEVSEFITDHSVGLFIATPEGVYDTINALNCRDIEMEYEVMFFMVSKSLLKDHDVSQDRIDRGNIQSDFIERYTSSEFKDLKVTILSDSDIHSADKERV